MDWWSQLVDSVLASSVFVGYSADDFRAIFKLSVLTRHRYQEAALFVEKKLRGEDLWYAVKGGNIFQ